MIFPVYITWTLMIGIRAYRVRPLLIERDYRAIKRRTCLMVGIQEFPVERFLLGGIEVACMTAKGQMKDNGA